MERMPTCAEKGKWREKEKNLSKTLDKAGKRVYHVCITEEGDRPFGSPVQRRAG